MPRAGAGRPGAPGVSRRVQKSLRSRIHGWKAPFRAGQLPILRVSDCLLNQSPVCVVRNCEFLWMGRSEWFQCESHGRELCVSDQLLNVIAIGNPTHDVSMQITRSTFATRDAPLALSFNVPFPAAMDGPRAPSRFALKFQVASLIPRVFWLSASTRISRQRRRSLSRPRLRRHFCAYWNGAVNGTSIPPTASPCTGGSISSDKASRGPKNLEEWKTFWGSKEADTREGRPRFQGGNVLSRVRGRPRQAHPRGLPPASRQPRLPRRQGRQGPRRRRGPGRPRPGLRTLEEDAGVSAVAQGYEAGRRKQKSPTAEPKAFVVLSGKGMADRKFDTLADAVQGAKGGDTIEIRGNGPFISQPIDIQEHAITIRAGTGYRPVIRGKAEGLDGNYVLFKVVPLVLEGLDLQVVGRKAHSVIIIATHADAPLFVANCRLLGDSSATCIWAGGWPTSLPASVQIRNSELYATMQVGSVVAVVCASDGTRRLLLDNCVHAGSHAFTTAIYEPESKGVSIRLTRNTFAATKFPLNLWGVPPAGLYAALTAPPITLDASENIFDGQDGLFAFEQHHEAVKEGKPLPLPEAKKVLQRLLECREHQNVLGGDDNLLAWRVFGARGPYPVGATGNASGMGCFLGPQGHQVCRGPPASRAATSSPSLLRPK